MGSVKTVINLMASQIESNKSKFQSKGVSPANLKKNFFGPEARARIHLYRAFPHLISEGKTLWEFGQEFEALI